MRVCLLTSDARHSTAGERIAALAERLDEATVVMTGTADWPGATHVDELTGSFDAAAAFGWQACLHVFRVDANAHAYVVAELEEARLWHGDERRLVAALTYDLPLTLIAPSKAIAAQLADRAPGRRVVVIEPGIRRNALDAPPPPSPGSGALRVATCGPVDEILARTSEPLEPVALGSADVLLALPEGTLTYTAWAMLAGVVPIVMPVDGHDELVTDGESGLVIGFDDVPGAARALDTLARDRELLARLRDGALRRAESLPTYDDEAAGVLEALRGAATDSAWPERLLLNARAVLEPIAQERRALDNALRAADGRMAELDAEVQELKRTLDERARAYKVGKKLEPLWRPLLRLRGTR